MDETGGKAGGLILVSKQLDSADGTELWNPWKSGVNNAKRGNSSLVSRTSTESGVCQQPGRHDVDPEDLWFYSSITINNLETEISAIFSQNYNVSL